MADKIILRVAIDDKTNAALWGRAQKQGLTKAGYIKKLIMDNIESEHIKNPDPDYILSVLKENAGLKLNYYKYKRKYKALNRILRGGLYLKIQGCKSLRMSYVNRRSRANTDEEKKALSALINFIQDEKTDLERIYDMCIEAIKD